MVADATKYDRDKKKQQLGMGALTTQSDCWDVLVPSPTTIKTPKGASHLKQVVVNGTL